MARPRYTAEDRTAREKLVAAFWRLLALGPYAKLTVLEVVRAAELNKNTFYYHYSGIDELAEEAVQATLDPKALLAALSSVSIGDAGAPASKTALDANLDRLCLVAGEHSSAALRQLLKDALRGAWCEALGIDDGQLTLEQRIGFEFALGGVLEVMAYRSRVATPFNFAVAAGVLVRNGVVDAVFRTIRPAAATTRAHADSAQHAE
ncbi:MAG: TetR family transcriptional regulator [Micropruina sp.]|nr:TetR family transcriptional regulator [Micropruina sp.]